MHHRFPLHNSNPEFSRVPVKPFGTAAYRGVIISHRSVPTALAAAVDAAKSGAEASGTVTVYCQ